MIKKMEKLNNSNSKTKITWIYFVLFILPIWLGGLRFGKIRMNFE